ncbi:lamin tail domain-containing protein [Flavobacterium sp.]|uniref:lamin tail domain-containing protein n=1 Tax=Flavobacterium sp. TaxID=239 RepID=UPI0028BEA5FD|nr:lamin tail domain-containing protein [Flavobacterium sp.]
MKFKLLILSLLFSVVGWGQATDLFISEYVEGSGNEKYIEIYNGTGVSVNLSDYRLRLYANGAGAPTNDVLLAGTLADGQVIVYKNSGSTLFAGINNAAVNFNGDDALALFKISTNANVDIFGRIGNDPGTAWTGTGYSTLDRTLRRKTNVCGGITVNPSGTGAGAFVTLTTEWDVFSIDTVSDLGIHSATCGSVTPPNIVLNSSNPAVGNSNITQATTNNVIYAFNLSITLADATLNNVVFNTSGSYAASNITNFKLWYSADATFNSGTDTTLDNETATLGPGSHTFTGFTRTINNGTTGYFFITTDIPCAATVGNDLTVSAIATADLTFVSGNKSGTAFASGTHTFVGATPNNVTGAATATCQNGETTVNWTTPTGCSDNVLVFVSTTPFTAAVPTGNGGAYTANTVFGSGTAFDGGFTVYKGTGTSVTVTGLTNGTTYYYKIFTRNGLIWSNGVTVNCTPTMVYCASGATNSIDSEIENVTLVGETTTISNNTANVCTTGVNNYTAMSADLEVGGSYTLSVEFGDCNGGPQYDGAGGVWIDWNNDGDFNDANETIGTAAVAVSGGNVIQDFTVSVPAGQPLGLYRMRIVQEEGGSSGSISPCGTFTYGSTEDYTVEVVVSCTPTTSVSSIAPTSGPVGTVVTINGSGFTTATSVSFGAYSAAFTLVSNSVIEATVPANATTGNITILDAGGCDLSYSSFTVITDDNSSCEGTAVTTDLIIYDIHDEYTGSGGFITIYNGTGATVDLTNYSVWRAGTYGGAYSDYANLTGTIASGALGILKVSPASCGPASTNGTIDNGFNEDDGIQLRNAAGTVVIDDVHTYVTDKGYYMVRNAGALSARTTYVAADWSITPLGPGVCEPSAGLVLPPSNGDSPSVTLNPVDVNIGCPSNSATLTVSGTEGVAGGLTLVYQWYVNVPGNAGWTAVSNGGVYSGATSTALNISSTSGLNNHQYYCQIRENTATCFTATEAAIIKDGATVWNGTVWSNGVPDATKTATINGNYDTATHGDFSCCSLVVNPTFRLDIRANDYVEIQYNLTVNGTLHVWDDGSLVQVDDSGVNTGNISYERITTGNNLDYVYWSSPVNGATTPATGLIYRWDPVFANPNTGWGFWILARNTAMAPGVGYIMRNIFNRTFTGVPRNGVVQPTIARANYTGTDFIGTNGVTITNKDDNWNLVGNPYPSAINVLDFLNLNANIEGSVRVWTHGTSPATSIGDPVYNNYVFNYTVDDYIVYNGTGTVSGPLGFNGFIAAGQSFMVNMNDGIAASETVTFNNSLRNISHNNEQFYRQTANASKSTQGTIEHHRIWLDLANTNNNSTRTLVGYVSNATYEKDRLYDAVTNALGNGMAIFSTINNERMSIQGRALPFDNQDRVPVGIKVPAAGTYSIGLSALDGLFAEGQAIYLEDLQLNIIHDLKANPYFFTLETAGFVNNRFVLRYTNQTLDNEEIENSVAAVNIYANEGINVVSTKEMIQSVAVYDVLGRLVAEKKNVAATSTVLTSVAISKSAYIVKVILENGVEVTKKILY